MNYEAKLQDFKKHLEEEEKSKNTIDKYIRDVKKYLKFIESEDISKQNLLEFKVYLQENFKPTSLNSIIAGINSFLGFLNQNELKLKPLKIQKRVFINSEKELEAEEYKKLVKVAEMEGDEKLSMMLQTICSTGIRISELQFVTVESLQQGKVFVNCKNKLREIFMPKMLIEKLELYCKKNQIEQGTIFCTRSGKAVDRSNIWRMLKHLSEKANVSQKKVFPHNLRHLFARCFYQISKDINKLADVLGHSDINTTRIYTMESGKEHLKQLERLDLVIK